MASAFQSIHSHSKMVCYTQNHPFYSRTHHLNENKKLLYAHTANTFKKIQILTSRRDKFIREHKLLWLKKNLKKKSGSTICLQVSTYIVYVVSVKAGETEYVSVCVCMCV